MNMAGGEIALWRSVILRALEDAHGYFAGTVAPEMRDLEQRRARSWFDSNRWDFRAVCHLADLDPERVEAHARKCLAEHAAGRVPAVLASADRYSNAQRGQHKRRRKGINMRSQQVMG